MSRFSGFKHGQHSLDVGWLAIPLYQEQNIRLTVKLDRYVGAPKSIDYYVLQSN